MNVSTKLSHNESEALKATAQKLSALRDYLNTWSLGEGLDLRRLKATVEQVQEIQGNLANDGSLIACVLARQFLQQQFKIPAFDAAAKPQGAPGLDVNVLTSSRERIIGEVKTTVPCGRQRRDLGANQKATFIKDFEKLERQEAHHKFFFVTNPLTHKAVSELYRRRLNEENIKLVLLDGEEESLTKKIQVSLSHEPPGLRPAALRIREEILKRVNQLNGTGTTDIRAGDLKSHLNLQNAQCCDVMRQLFCEGDQIIELPCNRPIGSGQTFDKQANNQNYRGANLVIRYQGKLKRQEPQN
jgi:hypothetical protein